MNSVDSAINLGIMSTEEGVQFIYSLANNNLYTFSLNLEEAQA